MTFTFPNPADTTEFKGDNGITYAWDVDDKKWQIKTFNQGYARDDIKEYVDAADSNLQLQIDRLKEQVDILNELTKGSVALYTLKNTNGEPVSRPGEFSTNTGFFSSITAMSFGTADAEGNPTKEMVDGNIIETFDPVEDKSNRFLITDASAAPTVVQVQYVSGQLFYAVGAELKVNIY